MPEIRPASTVEEPALRALYARAYPKRAEFLSAHWRWLYRVGAFPGIEPLVLADGDKLLGHAGAIPVELERAGRRAPAIWFVDFWVAPELQGQGKGGELTRAWMKMCPDRITYCNERSLKIFVKAGWKPRRDTWVCTMPIALPSRINPALKPLDDVCRAIGKLALLGFPRLDLRPLSDDPAALAWLDDDDKSGEPRVVRDAAWIRWRLLDHPRRAEHFAGALDGVGILVRLFESLGRRRAHLLALGPGAPKERARALSAFTRWAFERGADDAWLASNDPKFAQRIAASYFMPHEARFAWHSDDPAVFAALGRGIPVQGVDSDHDLMFPC